MPNRAAALSWDRSPERDRLVGAALALADAEGLDAVSIRRVAAVVEMRPMSIYTHVASKDDLVALMFDAASAEMLLTDLPADWRAAFTAIAESTYAGYLAHPWMLAALEGRPPPGPSRLARGEQALRALDGSPIAPGDRWTAVSVLYEWTMGHALHTITLAEPAEPAERFERSLGAVLDGIERRFAQPE